MKLNTLSNDKKTTGLFVVISIFSVCILMRDIVGIGVSKYVFIFIACCFMAFADKSMIYEFIAFITPVATGLPYTYICAIAILILIMKKPLYKLKLGPICCMLAIAFLEIISAFRFDFSLVEFLRFLGVFLVVFMRMCDQDSSYNNEKMLKLFVLGFLVASASVWGQMLVQYSWTELLKLGVRIGNTKEMLDITEGMCVSYNQNGYASLCLTSMWVSFIMFRNTRRKNERFLLWLIISFSILQGVLTQSRMFIILLTVSIFLVILDTEKSIKDRLGRLAGIGALLLMVVLLMKNYFGPYLENLIARFSVSDLSGSRLIIMQQYSGKWHSNILNMCIGVGMQNYNGKYEMFYSAHNSIQEVLLIWGIVGMIAVTILFAAILLPAMKKNHHNWIQFVPFVLYIISAQSLQGFSDRSGLLRLMIVYSVIHLEYTASRKNRGKILC